jgi:hypothetical protein
VRPQKDEEIGRETIRIVWSWTLIRACLMLIFCSSRETEI